MGDCASGRYREAGTRRGKKNVLGMIPAYLMKYGAHHGVFPAFWKAFLDSRCCWAARWIIASGEYLKRAGAYCFYHCRPARGLRIR